MSRTNTIVVVLFVGLGWSSRLLAQAETSTLPKRVDAVQISQQDDLPDGELDLPDGDFDDDGDTATSADPEAGTATPVKAKPDVKPEVKPDVKPPKVTHKPEEVLPPPDERATTATTSDRHPAAISDEPEDPGPWVADDVDAHSRQPLAEVVGDDDIEAGRVAQADAETSLTDSPWFWPSVGVGSAVVVGAAVGGGFLIYYLINGDKGTVTISLE